VVIAALLALSAVLLGTLAFVGNGPEATGARTASPPEEVLPPPPSLGSIDEGVTEAESRSVVALGQEGASSPWNEASILRVTDEEGAPVPDARVALEDTRDELRTGEDGTVLLGEGLRVPQAGLVCSPGFRLGGFDVRRGVTDVVLEADPGTPVRVIWRDTHEPIPEARIVLRFFRHDWPDGASRLLRTTYLTDESGEALLRLPTASLETGLEIEVPDGPRLFLTPESFRLCVDSWVRRPTLLPVDRRSPRHRIAFRGPDGQPLVHAPVEYEIRGTRYRGTTDGRGEMELHVALPPWQGYLGDTELRPRLFVELGEDRYWIDRGCVLEWKTASIPTVHANHAPFPVRVGGGDPTAYDVASVQMEERVVRRALDRDLEPAQGFPSDPEELVWLPVGAPGSLLVDRGWQADSTVVLLRHRASGLLMDWAVAKRDGEEALLEAKAVRSITLENADPTVRAGWILRLSPCSEGGMVEDDGYGKRVHEVELASLPVTLEVPAGFYLPSLRPYPRTRRLAIIDATESDARFLLDLGPARLVRGIVRGQLSGPLANVGVTARGGGPSQDVARTRTDSGGRFELRLVGEGEVSLRTRWNDWGRSRNREQREAVASAAKEWVEIVRPEARLLVTDSATDLLAGLGTVNVYDGDGRGQRRLAYRKLAAGETWEVIVPPGVIQVRKRIPGGEVFEDSLELAAGEEGSITMATIDASPLKIHFLHEERIWYDLELQLLDEAEDEVFENTIGFLEPPPKGTGPKETRMWFAAPPGEWQLRLTGTTYIQSGQDEFDAMYDDQPYSWTGRVSCEENRIEAITVTLAPF